MPYPGQPTTPDGVLLAGWLQRAGAFLIDYLAVSAVVLVVTLPLQICMQRKLQAVLEQLNSTAPGSTPDLGAFFRDYLDILLPLIRWSGIATFLCWTLHDKAARTNVVQIR